MTIFEYHHAGNSEAQQKAALAYLLNQSSAGKAVTGVLSGLAVAQTGTASGSVTVGAGAGVAQSAVLDGASMVVNDTQVALDVLGANPVGGVARNDIVALDAATRSLLVLVGTPNAVPTDPTVPATAVPLSRLRHAASATTVPTSKIDDLRTFTSLLPAAVTDTGWISLTVPTGWSVPFGVPWQVRRVGDRVEFRGALVNSSFSGGYSALVTLPASIPKPPVIVGLTVTSNTSIKTAVLVNDQGSVQAYASAPTSAWYLISGSYRVN